MDIEKYLTQEEIDKIVVEGRNLGSSLEILVFQVSLF